MPILLLPALGRWDDPVLRAATYVGATSVLLSLIGLLRWVFVVPPLAHAYLIGDATTKAAVGAAWLAQHQFGGAPILITATNRRAGNQCSAPGRQISRVGMVGDLATASWACRATSFRP